MGITLSSPQHGTYAAPVEHDGILGDTHTQTPKFMAPFHLLK